jgi:ABC-type transport system involved in cytochrome c biogenesis permease subunit
VKRFLPALILLLALCWTGLGWLPARSAQQDFDLTTFGKTPVLLGGRVKPLDTVARNSLLIIHGRETLRLANGQNLRAMRWLTDTVFKAPVADGYPAFVIQNADVLGLFGWEQKDQKYFSYTELKPFLRQVEEQGALSDKLQSMERSAYQNAVLNLRNGLVLYQRLKNSLQPEDATNWSREVDSLSTGAPSSKEVTQQIHRNQQLAEPAYIIAVPPAAGDRDHWRSIGESILQTIGTAEVHPIVRLYARIGDAWRAGDHAVFNQQVLLVSDWMAKQQPKASGRSSFEYFFNRADPFGHSMVLYVAAFLLACGSWLTWSRPLQRSAFLLLLLALVIHTFGLAARIYLQERPPVTNLYSSAIFIGWGAVIVALILERLFGDGIGAVCGGAIGFLTLVIAHHLAGSGDTLEMLQAVLDTNLWLATHVVAITTGYSAMFLAGTLAIIYIVRGVFTRSLSPRIGRSLARMTYGVVCFATFFSFVGTVLGGIWADQSWGRFWGWDPKENGAVLIVLWCAMILHARWGGFIRDRGLMVMAVFGNVITSFSWFGVNMLGVGLHSYGFMQKAFPWLCGFVLSQLVLMGFAALPLERWRSFRELRPASVRRPGVEFPVPELAVETH